MIPYGFLMVVIYMVILLANQFIQITARKPHPLGWRGIAGSFFLIKYYYFFANFHIYYVIFLLSRDIYNKIVT